MGAPKPKTLEARDRRLQDIFLEALLKSKTPTGALKAMGLSYAVYKRWVENDVLGFNERLETTEMKLNDLVQSVVWEHIAQKNLIAAIFWLKHRDPRFKIRIDFKGSWKIPKITEQDKKELEALLNNRKKLGAPQNT